MTPRVLLASFILLIAILSLVFFQFQTPFVTLEFEKEAKIGDKISGNLYINQERLKNPESQAILYLSKNNTILEASTLSLSEISSQETSSINIGSLLDYTFNETGKYTIEFYIPENEYKTSKTFTIN